jgi:NAD(P)H dehydrogenase (quinone)
MNILIVYAHPSKKSYTFQILEQIVKELTKENHTVMLSDLYEMNFLSDMSEREYEREGFKNIQLPISKDVGEEHAKIEKADGIIFLYPVWWSDCPAKLKGWFDRVYSVGYAYGFSGNEENAPKMKVLKLGQVICTAGYSNNYLEEIGIARSMEKVMLDDRLGVRVEIKQMVILGGTLKMEEVRLQHSEKISEVVRQIEAISYS